MVKFGHCEYSAFVSGSRAETADHCGLCPSPIQDLSLARTGSCSCICCSCWPSKVSHSVGWCYRRSADRAEALLSHRLFACRHRASLLVALTLPTLHLDAWPPGQRICISVQFTRPVLYLEIIVLKRLYPPRYLALWLPKVQQPREGGMVSAQHKFFSVEVSSEISDPQDHCQQLSSRHTIIPLWSAECSAEISNYLLTLFPCLRQDCPDSHVAGIGV